MPERDHHSRKLKERKWSNIAFEWIARSPLGVDSVADPEFEVEELTSLLRIFEQLRNSRSSGQSYFDNIDGFYEANLIESIAMLRRAGHIIRCGINSSTTGYRTWSRATSYQSAFFSMRAICNLLGCTILHDKAFNKYYQFDLWTPTRNRRLKGITESDFRIAVHLRPNPRHIGYWSIFNRLICATKIDNKIWPYTLIDPIKKIMTDKFIKQRNNLHYKSSYWIFSDLLKCDNNESLEELSEIFTSGNSWTEENEIHFDVLLALQLLRMGTLLLNNIGESNPLIKLESSSILSWIEDIRELESFVAIGSTG